MKKTQEDSLKKIISAKNILIVQDIDGVCIPLVKDPLKRVIDIKYVQSTKQLDGEFAVLTCGEHEGRRGVNRIVEEALRINKIYPYKGNYLPGLASCGVELQDKLGNVVHPGLSNEEIAFLARVPKKMERLLTKGLKEIIPEYENDRIRELVDVAICDTRFTPTLNLNEILSLFNNDLKVQKKLQIMMEKIMNDLLDISIKEGLKDSFYLHMMPNLGNKNGKEAIKFASKGDIGTTDIQFIINGAIKEAGLLVILNRYIKNITGKAPFGDNFNVRSAPKEQSGLLNLCYENISKELMPLLVGVGDTVTSNKDKDENLWLRGGSDRGFLTLIQSLGKLYQIDNQIIFVNSGNAEVYRPKATESSLEGISDPLDVLKFNTIFYDGPEEYVNWFSKMARARYSSSRKKS